jgi:hypothetical protein
MEVKITPASSAIAPWTDRAYLLNVVEIKTDLSASINEHPISDKNTFLFSQYLHPTSKIIIDGVLTADSDIQGSTIEEKKDNLIDAAALWWSYDDAKVKANCALLYYRGWEQYVMIESLDIEKVAGDEIEYFYTLTCVVHEGE